MGKDRETNLVLFIDFDNVALGARDARQRFDIQLLLQRILEKGKIIVKKAYADWHYYKEYMGPLHEAAIELIEVPMPRISGKNSADIRLVVDAMDLCYAKDHIDTFVIVSGDSDFSPLVSKLRENNKRVIGVGNKNSSSNLLIGNCDEFIFYDDIYQDAVGQVGQQVDHVPEEKRELFDFLVKTTQSLLQESRGVLYSSLIKDTMTRKQPDFNERTYGYSTFGDLLDDARRLGLLAVERDARAGGTWVVQGLGKGLSPEGPERPPTGRTGGKSRRSRRRSGGARGVNQVAGKTPGPAPEPPKQAAPAPTPPPAPTAAAAAPAEPASAESAKPAEKKVTKKAVKKTAKKTPTAKPAGQTTKKTRKKTTKKTVAGATGASVPPAKKKTTKKAPAK